MEKTARLYAVFKARCPQCRRGSIFTGSMYGLNIQRTLHHCPHCELRYEVEPGYFYAAMYVSYAMNMVQMILMGLATYYCSGRLDFDSVWLYVGVIFLGSLLLSPFNYRYSRVILLHYLSPKISYKPAYDR